MRYVISIAAAASPLAALAHTGHGSNNAASLAHLLETPHAAIIGMTIVLATVGIAYARRQTTNKQHND